MIFNHIKIMIIFMLFTLVSSASFASGEAHKKPAAHAAKKTTKHIIAGPTCVGFGPQTPRDIDGLQGTNPQQFSLAPKSKGMNLCNIHFHNNAEHKARAFSIYAGEGDHGHGGGYQCNISKSLSQAELKVPATKICKGLKPGAGLGSCLSKKCANPDLRVETQVFTLVNDPSALNFNHFAYGGNMAKGRHQAKSLPTGTGHAVDFMGSTTGPKYTESTCSPLQVTWAVRPRCAKLDINIIGEWCKGNDFGEDHAHGVRKLVTNPKLLSIIK